MQNNDSKLNHINIRIVNRIVIVMIQLIGQQINNITLESKTSWVTFFREGAIQVLRNAVGGGWVSALY